MESSVDPITLLIIGAAIAFMIFWTIRSNKKRADDQKQMMNSMTPGTRVMLAGGMFGTIRAVGDQQMVIELAPGMDVTVIKEAVRKVLTPADEEFEYADDELEATDPKQIEAADGVIGDDLVEGAPPLDEAAPADMPEMTEPAQETPAVDVLDDFVMPTSGKKTKQ